MSKHVIFRLYQVERLVYSAVKRHADGPSVEEPPNSACTV